MGVSMEQEVRRAIWEGSLPLQISLDLDELEPYLSPNSPSNTSTTDPNASSQHGDVHTLKASPFMVMTQRSSYLPLLLPQIRRQFSRWIGRIASNPACERKDNELDMSQPWFSFDGRPLNWHYPIGLLHDLLVADSRIAKKRHANLDEQLLLPFKLTLHFTEYPKTILPFVDPDVGLTSSMYQTLGDSASPKLPRPSSMSLQSYLYSSLKQADCLRFGTCKRMNNLSKSAQVQLWDALWTHSFDRYWKVNDGLVKQAGPEQQTSLPQRVPMRCYVVQEDGIKVLQWPVRLEGSTVRTIAEQISPGSGAFVLLHGLELDPSTPLEWLCMHAAYADNFLHFVVINP